MMGESMFLERLDQIINLIEGLNKIEQLKQLLKHLESIHALLYFLIVILGFIVIWLIIYNVLRRFI